MSHCWKTSQTQSRFLFKSASKSVLRGKVLKLLRRITSMHMSYMGYHISYLPYFFTQVAIIANLAVQTTSMGRVFEHIAALFTPLHSLSLVVQNVLSQLSFQQVLSDIMPFVTFVVAQDTSLVAQFHLRRKRKPRNTGNLRTCQAQRNEATSKTPSN